MPYRDRLAAAIGGRWTVVGIGGLYAVLGALWVLVEVSRGTALSRSVILGALIAGPGVVLLVGGALLPRTDVEEQFYGRVAGWCVAAVGGVAGVLALYHLQPAGGIRNPGRVVLVFSGIVVVPAFLGGVKDALAKTQTHELRERNRELEAARDELARQNRELERTRADLERTVERLEASNDRLEQFAYAASHDLQEPLRMVSSYLQLLERRYGPDLDDDAQEFIEYAVDGADRMRSMIESLLQYSRVTHAEAPEPTDVDALLDEVLQDLEVQVEETDATVSSDDLPTVLANPEQLSLVFQNLLSNAIAYSGDEPPRVHVGVDRTDGKWRFSVADEGVGIPPEYHDRIFEVFEQLQGDDGTGGDRTSGIGLALCERIVEHHGGEIWVESEPGEGATFYFTIPVAEEAEDVPASAPQSEPAG